MVSVPPSRIRAAQGLVPLAAAEAAFDALVPGRVPAARDAFISQTRHRARSEAAAGTRRLRQDRRRGPLDGVLVAYKDLFDVAGTVTTGGSPTREDLAPAQADAAVVAALTAAGMVCVGKTNLSPLAFSGLGVNPHFGTPPNPYDPARVPGGSSSGAAVAVAAGIVPVAMASDTSGSARVPAAWCGLAGYKASRTRYSHTGMLALAPTLDSIGIIAATVTDVITVDAVLRARPAPPPPHLRSLRLMLPAGALDGADSPTAAAVGDAAGILARAGADITTGPLPVLEAVVDLFAAHGTLVAAEAARTHPLPSLPHADRLDPRITARLAAGARITDADISLLRRRRARLRREAAARLDGRLLLTPTVRHGPPVLADLADPQVFARVNATALRTTMTLSYLDMPGVTLPVHQPGTLPAGLLVSALHGADTRLLAAAAAIEHALGRQ
ncbi:amidase family protein [Streptomyces lushanensis]|uniref:amidase family protein n=1 Tax=Streptomyces lushanensis TaxID=1434255 RepID=UPI00082E9F76|nr:amidase family protein [Streptomyces lushanensis]